MNISRRLTHTLATPTSHQVDQTASPEGHLAMPFSDQAFEKLGSGVTVGESTLIVQLTNLSGTADKTVVADAVYLLRKAPMSQSIYNSQGLLTATNDALGNQTTYAYDALGRMVRVTQPDPDGAGSLAAPIASSHYNGAGQLSAAIGPDLSVSTFQYDTLGRQTAVHRGGLVHNRARAYAETGPWSDGSNQGLFDTERVATTVTGSATAAATWTFGGLTVGDDYGVFLTWTADAGNAEDASIKIYAGSTGTTPIWTETVDMTQAPGAARNSVLQPIDFAAKDFQRLDGVFTATAGTIIIELSNLSATAGRMVVADTVYVVREDAIGRTVYDHAGRIWKTLDPEGYATTRTYDNLGRLVKLSQPDPDNGGNNPALVVEYAYDAAGETTHVTETNAASSFARVSKTDYDAHGRVSRSVRIIGQDDDSSAETDDIVTAYGYDALGRMTSQTDPLNHATSYTFDNLGRKTRETNALSGQTDYAYDIAGRMTSLTDPEGNATRWAFGISGGVFTESINVNSADLVRTFEYNAAGNLTRKIDRNGRVIAYGYDALSRQTTETWYDNVADADAQHNARKTYTTAYNDLGQVASIGDGATEYEYTYGLFGNLTSTTQDLSGLTPDVKFAYRYDSSGRLAEVAASIGPVADYVTTYSYDRIGRITRIEQDDAGGKPVAEKRIDFDYDAAGDLKEIKRYAELAAANLVARTDYVFDAIGRLTDLAHARNQITLADYDLTWDAAGRITDFDFTSLIGNAGAAGYAYDNTDQLTGADYDFQTDESYSYDDNGNRTNTGYATGDHNRLSSDGTYNYTYDGEGNVTSKTKISDSTSIEYTWDHRNRLVKVTFKNSGGTPTRIVEYTYDNGQRWIRKTLDTNADGTIEQSQIFVHDQGQIVLDFQKTGAEPATTLDLARRYLWGPAVDQLLADETVDDGTADDVSWVLGDHLNSVRDLAVYDPVTQMVSVVKHVTFDAFGNVTSDSAPGVKVLFLFTARPFDPDSDLQNNGFRWYDLSTARWMSADPIGFSAGDVNLYRYVKNWVLSYRDPHGLYEIAPVPPPWISPLDPPFNPGIGDIPTWPPSLAPPDLIANPGGVLQELAEQAVEQYKNGIIDSFDNLLSRLEGLGFHESAAFGNQFGSSSWDVEGRICNAGHSGIEAAFNLRGLGSYRVSVLLPPQTYQSQLTPNLTFTAGQKAEFDASLGLSLNEYFTVKMTPQMKFQGARLCNYALNAGAYLTASLFAKLEYEKPTPWGSLTAFGSAMVDLAGRMDFSVVRSRATHNAFSGWTMLYQLQGGAAARVRLPAVGPLPGYVDVLMVGGLEGGYATATGDCSLPETEPVMVLTGTIKYVF